MVVTVVCEEVAGPCGIRDEDVGMGPVGWWVEAGGFCNA
jgi:hypothetical protein